MDTIGGRIKKLRVEKGMTQEELAIKLGYAGKTSINKIESGAQQLTQRKIKAFAEALSTTPAHLMGWDSQDDKKPNEARIRMPITILIDESCSMEDNSEINELIELYKKSDDTTKEMVKRILKYNEEMRKHEKP